MAALRFLGIDPGLANLGWAVLEVSDRACFRAVGTLETEKITRKGTVRAAADNTRRTMILAEAVGAILLEWEISLICGEELSFMRNASAAAKNAMSWAAVVAVAAVGQVGVIEISPKDLQAAIVGLAGRAKVPVQRAMETRFPELAALWPLGPRGGGALVQHASDASAAAYACLSSNEARAAMRAAGVRW